MIPQTRPVLVARKAIFAVCPADVQIGVRFGFGLSALLRQRIADAVEIPLARRAARMRIQRGDRIDRAAVLMDAELQQPAVPPRPLLILHLVQLRAGDFVEPHMGLAGQLRIVERNAAVIPS